MASQRLFLVRHGETEWSKSGRHTGKTDIPLTEEGKTNSLYLGRLLKEIPLQKILVSPSKRAQETYTLLHLLAPTETTADLQEWDYGDYEGLTSKEIVKRDPTWNVFEKGAPGGESIAQVEQRADRVLQQIQNIQGDVLLVSSAHILRSLAARWLRFPVEFGKHLMLSPASLSILTYEHQNPSILVWNEKKLPTGE